MLAHQRGETAAGSDLQEDRIVQLEQPFQPIGKAHGLAELPDPVFRIGCLGRHDPVARHVGNESQPGFREPRRLETRAEGRKNGFDDG
jgi:hypothetical protein